MKNKRILSLVLAFAMILGTFSFAFAAAPKDVVDTEYEAAVDTLIQLGALDGYPDGTFKPNNQITREEFAAALIKTKGLKSAAEAATGLSTGFTDVPATRWSSGYVGLAAKLGIVNGIGNNKFAPAAPVKYEEAVTMIMRALGYEPAAKSRGGYPVGYLVLANEAKLLDSVNGTQGTPALRGTIAQLLYNALRTPMMVQVGYGDQAIYVKSGEADTELKTLLGELGYKSKVDRVTEINEGKGFIRIGNEVFYVDEEFDFQEALGLTLRAWYDRTNTIVLYNELDTPVFDSAMYYKGGLYLPSNGVYDFATDTRGVEIATLILNGKKVAAKDFNADYAKVVFDSYGDVIWAEGFTFDGNIAVEKIDGNVVESYGYEELSLKGYTIVDIDGKTISIDDLEENDIVFYNKDNKFAVVANMTVEGTVDKVYTDKFVVAGERYDIDGRYLDGDYMGDLDHNILASMRKEEEKATVYFDFWGNVVLVVGKTAPSTTSSNYFLLLAKSKEWIDPRSKVEYYTLDVLNDEGKVVSYDVKKSEINDKYDSVKFIVNGKDGNWADVLVNGDSVNTILKLSINSNDKVTKVEIVENYPITSTLGVTSKYVDKFKLQNNTVIFRPDGNSYSVTTWEKADEEFTKILSGKYYVGDAGRVAAIFAEDTNAKDATTNYAGRIKDIRTLRNGLKEVDILVEGEEYTFATGPDTVETAELEEYEMFNLKVVNKTETIEEITDLDKIEAAKITGLKPGSKVIDTDKGTFELMDKAVIYTGRVTTLRFADLEIGDYLDIYPMIDGSRFIMYAVKVDGPKAPETTEGVVTYINDTRIFIDGERYAMDEDTVLYDKDGKTVKHVGGENINSFLTTNSLVKDVEVKDNVVTEMTLVKTAEEIEEEEAAKEKEEADKKAAADVVALIEALEEPTEENLDKVKAAVAEVNEALEALNEEARAFVSEEALAELEAVELAIVEVEEGLKPKTVINVSVVAAALDFKEITISTENTDIVSYSITELTTVADMGDSLRAMITDDTTVVTLFDADGEVVDTFEIDVTESKDFSLEI